MKRRIVSFGLMLILVLGLSTVVYASDGNPTITFDGSSELIYEGMDDPENGEVFENMQPGETRTKTIELLNAYDQTVDFYMNTEVVSAFEDLEDASNAAYSVRLSVTQGDETTVIYGSGDEAARIGGDDEGLYDLNGSLNESFLVASLAEGETAVVSLEIQLDGESHGNSYMAANADLQLEFYVSYDEATVVTNTVYVKGDTITVQTGDNSLLAIYTVMLIICIAAVVSVVVIKRRYKHE